MLISKTQINNNNNNLPTLLRTLAMVFYIIGLGLGDEKDISVKGLEAIRSCDAIYLESYTSILGVNKEKLEAFYGKPIIDADRECVEETFDSILDEIKKNEDKNAALLVIGDPFCATTHSDLFLRAIQRNLKVEVIHNASIVNAVGACGMQVYRFGEIVTLPFFTEKWRPYSFYEKILKNREMGLHTLCLLDIKTKERNIENLMKGKRVYEPPRFMSCKVAVEQLLECEDNMKKNAFSRTTKCIGLARIGMDGQRIAAGNMEDFLEKIDMGPPLHSFVICSEDLHIIEKEMFEYYGYEKLVATTATTATTQKTEESKTDNQVKYKRICIGFEFSVMAIVFRHFCYLFDFHIECFECL
eukprot:TRINITY_DN13920_c0_g2_i1.p1 TRINITY_DN13920_c0_g2~~TRINITY_DN13920_c0_g2_i1.p1  ORF type:complete len:357 (-),score=94.89 TRINITY_DN13920_c0_g2_i1:489-1559(-)